MTEKKPTKFELDKELIKFLIKHNIVSISNDACSCGYPYCEKETNYALEMMDLDGNMTDLGIWDSETIGNAYHEYWEQWAERRKA